MSLKSKILSKIIILPILVIITACNSSNASDTGSAGVSGEQYDIYAQNYSAGSSGSASNNANESMKKLDDFPDVAMDDRLPQSVQDKQREGCLSKNSSKPQFCDCVVESLTSKMSFNQMVQDSINKVKRDRSELINAVTQHCIRYMF